ncbi:MAG: flagellar hook assembly protein FlgD [Spirochaetales bacterium]|nr:flagellar hook assembly protein FlgD [Spirochaetales bacterium]MBP7262713.1 flagellar hook assembly protein FlgD [Spirochaetia bacterium]
MTVNTNLSAQDLLSTQMQVDAFNKTLSQGRSVNKELDKDDFLKILITQLQHQDPTSPMEDREFISQMAQFSSLEQMTNMASGFGKLSSVLASSEAQSLLGKNVEVVDQGNALFGRVEQVVRGEFPLVLVNGKFYDLEQVSVVAE